MKRLLVIQSSLFENGGQSGYLVGRFVEQWQQQHADGEVTTRDLTATPPPHLTQEALGLFASDEPLQGEQAALRAFADTLIAELRDADEVVIGMPMYNFTVPSTFKAWMDHVARAGTTFRYTESGPQGLLENRPVTVIASRGGYYQGTENDTQTPLLRLFFRMLGLENLRFVYAEGLALGEETAERAINSALGDLTGEQEAA